MAHQTLVLAGIVIVGAGAVWGYKGWKLFKKSPDSDPSHDAPDRMHSSNTKDHPPGNAIPTKVEGTFQKISSYINSPWDPTNNMQSMKIMDASNIPRTDYITVGGGRLSVHGVIQLGRSNKPGHPTGPLPSDIVTGEAPIQTTAPTKNLDEHKTLFASKLNRKDNIIKIPLNHNKYGPVQQERSDVVHHNTVVKGKL